ncbi:MAG: efflux RND transporter periplasmic adaptor subunit [Chitinophagales bacterium]|nr:efflux RND transporter periplasmic adaptor subunit [Chitinophagales bacterium]
MKKILSIVALVAFVIYASFTLVKNKKAIEKNTKEALNIEKYNYIPVKVYKVTDELNTQTIEELGSFQARQELTVTSTANGRLMSLNVREGQYVSKGTLIAQIESSALSSQLATAQAALANAKKDLERVENANKVGATTKMQIEQAQLQIENINSNIAAINEQMKFYRVTAPMSGYVNKMMIEPGSFMMAGTPILEMVDISTVKLVVKVDEKWMPLLKLGQTVNVKTEVYPDKDMTGKISRIGVKADASKKYEIEIDLPNNANQLKAGMYARATFSNLDTIDAMYIPRSAIVGSVKDAQVYIVNADSTVSLIPVTVGDYQGNNIEIKSGLQQDNQVVVMGQINLKDGEKVAVVQ